jgi:hypothetical protein
MSSTIGAGGSLPILLLVGRLTGVKMVVGFVGRGGIRAGGSSSGDGSLKGGLGGSVSALDGGTDPGI